MLAEGFNPPFSPTATHTARSVRRLPVLSPDNDTKRLLPPPPRPRRLIFSGSPISPAVRLSLRTGCHARSLIPGVKGHVEIPAERGLKCRSQLEMRLDVELTSAAQLIQDKDPIRPKEVYIFFVQMDATQQQFSFFYVWCKKP